MVSLMKFSAEYVDRLSPADRKIYLFYYEKDLEEEQKRKNKANNGINLM